MKVFIGGSKSISKLDEAVVREIENLVEQGDEILIGDCFGADALVQSELVGYEKVTVYSPFEKGRNNAGGWDVRQRGKRKIGLFERPYLFYAAKDTAMTIDADCGLMIWDGKSKGTFINMMNLVILEKEVKVFLCERASFVTVRTADDLEEILNAKPSYVPYRSFLPKELYEPAIRQCCFSKEMEEYLLKESIRKFELLKVINGAPVPLKKKYEILKTIAETDDMLMDLLRRGIMFSERQNYVSGLNDARSYLFSVVPKSYSYALKETEEALKELDRKSEALFTLEEAWYDLDILEEKKAFIEPFTSFEAVVEYIRKEAEEYPKVDESLGWNEVSVWRPTTRGRMKCRFTYIMFGEEIIYFERSPRRFFYELIETDKSYDYEFELAAEECARKVKLNSGSLSLDLPIPFKAGDIVYVDCLPFVEPKPVVLLEVNNWDCCGVQVLYRDYDSLWRTGALKHGECWDRYRPPLSPLYRLAEFKGELSEEEQIMTEVWNFVRRDEKNGAKLQRKVSHGEGQTEKSIREYIKDQEGN